MRILSILLLIPLITGMACPDGQKIDRSTNGDESSADPKEQLNRELLKAAESAQKPQELIDLINRGADVNTRDKNNNTPAMLAAKAFKGILFLTLVQYGAKVGLKNNDGKTAVDLLNEPLSIEDILKRLKTISSITNKEEHHRLTQASYIKRYAAIADYKVPDMFQIVPNPGAGSCFFYSVAPFLKEIFPGQYNNFANQADVRNFLTAYLNTPAGQAFANIRIPTMQAADPQRYARPGKVVNNVNDLVDLITNNGIFAGETFWGDELTDALAREVADIVVIKIEEREFGHGKNIFYCQYDVDKKYVALMKYHSDIHFEAMKYVSGGKERYTFDRTKELPSHVKTLIDAYVLQCKQ